MRQGGEVFAVRADERSEGAGQVEYEDDDGEGKLDPDDVPSQWSQDLQTQVFA